MKQLLVSCGCSDSLKGLCSLKAWVRVSPCPLLWQFRVFFAPAQHTLAPTFLLTQQFVGCELFVLRAMLQKDKLFVHFFKAFLFMP